VADLRQRAWARWQAAAGPWRGWAICPALSMPQAPAAAGAASAADVPDLSEVLQPGETPGVRDPTEVSRTDGSRRVVDLTERLQTDGTPAVLDLTDVLRTEGTAVLLDLDPLVGIRSAGHASRRGLGHVVLVLPRWPHTDAILPTGALVTLLLESSRRLGAQPVASNVVFILDAERQTPVRRPAHDARVDNRYPITASDLPNLATLQRAGIKRVVKVTSAR
jgi:hypothetical protein